MPRRPTRIERIVIANFRGFAGATTIELGSRGTIVFGPNGTGKSSIVDALEKLLTALVSSLDHRGQGLSSEVQGRHILSEGPTRIAATLTGSGELALGVEAGAEPPAVAAYRRAAREPLYILRRSQLIRFIDAKPKDRYDQLKPFLPLDRTEAREAAMKKAVATLEGQAQRAADIARQAEHEAARVLGIPAPSGGLTEAAALEVLRAPLAALGGAALATMEDVPAARAWLKGTRANRASAEARASLDELGSALADLDERLGAVDAGRFIEALEALRTREDREARVFFEAVLADGAQWIEREGRADCPLCEQAIDAARVLLRVRERLTAVEGLVAQRAAVTQALRALDDERRQAADALARVARLLGKPDRPKEPLASVEALTAALEAMGSALRAGLPAADAHAVRDAAGAVAAARARVAEAAAAVRERAARLPSADQATLFFAEEGRLERFEERWGELGAARAAAQEAAARAAVAKRLGKHLVDARKEIVGGLFRQLSADVDELFGKLRRDGNLRGVNIQMKAGGAGSATLDVDFYSKKDQDPRGYYSDANLDMLGLSVFLALRRWMRRAHPEFDLLVLDDVLDSVDHGHALAVAQCLRTEFSDYQIVLTTHHRVFFERFKQVFRGPGYLVKEIRAWRIDRGPDLRDAEDTVAMLRRIRASGADHEIASAAGLALEKLLSEMRSRVRVSIPAEPDDRYTLEPLWDGFRTAAKKHHPALTAAIAAPAASIEAHKPIRNWLGAHHNEWASDIAPADVLEFADAVVELWELLHCATCGELVARCDRPEGDVSCRRGCKRYSSALPSGQ